MKTKLSKKANVRKWDKALKENRVVINNDKEAAAYLEALQKRVTAADILQEMTDTFKERSAVYKDNYIMVGRVMEVLFPAGIQLAVARDYDVWHLFELKIVKLTRFAISGLSHIDSIHDDAVYSAMVEAIIKQRNLRGEDHPKHF